MSHPRSGQIAVIFISESSGEGSGDYETAAEAMAELVAQQPGFLGVDWVGGEDGREITISYWADDASAAAWRSHPEHSRIREQGRGRWLKSYDLMVATINRGHQWERG
jgi:heme-degrading monooxygenase HmoA